MTDAIFYSLRQAAKKHIKDIKKISQNVFADAPLIVLAMGGTARHEQYMHADIDICIIWNNRCTHPQNMQSAMHLFYEQIWQTMNQISPMMIDLSELPNHFLQDGHFATSILHAQLIYGFRSLFWRVLHQHKNFLKQYNQIFFEKRQQENHHRQKKHPLFLLQPNCKEDTGALRDYHELIFIGKLCGLPNILRHACIWRLRMGLQRFELKKLRKQLIFFMNLRQDLHQLVQKNHNIMHFEQQMYLAQKKFPMRQNAHEWLMYHYFRAARVLHQIHVYMMHQLHDYWHAHLMQHSYLYS